MSRSIRFISKSKRRLTFFGALAVALMAAVAAVAYFTTIGSGSGSAQTGTAQSVTISAGVTPTVPLFPGGSGDVTVSISNPNPTDVHIQSLLLDTSQGTSGFSVDSGHSGCVLSTLSFTTQTNGGVGWTVVKKVGATNGVLSLDLLSAVAMTNAAVNACQSATFTVFLKVGP